VETEGHGPEHGVLEPQSARRSGAPAPATRSIPDRSRPCRVPPKLNGLPDSERPNSTGCFSPSAGCSRVF
jgi:hypothetical protein